MDEIHIQEIIGPSVGERDVEIVERKGLATRIPFAMHSWNKFPRDFRVVPGPVRRDSSPQLRQGIVSGRAGRKALWRG